jgi:hypothetical protein
LLALCRGRKEERSGMCEEACEEGSKEERVLARVVPLFHLTSCSPSDCVRLKSIVKNIPWCLSMRDIKQIVPL